MKEKLKKILNTLIFKLVLKSLIIILTIIIFFYMSIFLYSYFYEYDKLKIDNYNFNQLEQVKDKFKSLTFDDVKVYNIGYFNKKYDANITPIKNCYYFAVGYAGYGGNGKYPYIFGFQLESTFYKILNSGKYYSYPGYDLNSNIKMSTGLNPDPLNKYPNNKHFEINRDEKFIQKVSNPCSELDFYDRDK